MSAHPMKKAISGIVEYLLIDPTLGTTAQELAEYHENAATFYRSLGNDDQAEWAEQLGRWARDAIAAAGEKS